MRKKIMILALTLILLPINVSAKVNDSDVFYVNYKGVEFTEAEYTYLVDNLGETFVMIGTSELINQALADITSIEILEPVNGTMTLLDGDLYFMPLAVKQNDNGGYAFLISAFWHTNPNTRSFDVLGMNWGTSNFIITDFEASQLTMNAGFVDYNRNGTNTKEASQGIATSMNLINDASTLNLELCIYGSFTKPGTYTVNLAYLHSTTSINLSQSHNFTFSQSGLGGVAYYGIPSLRNQFEVKNTSYTITID